MGNAVVHFELMADGGGEDAARFYGELFGWRSQSVEGGGAGYRTVDTGAGNGITGGIGEFEGAPPYVTVYVQVDDIDATLARAVQLGGEVFAPRREVAPRLYSGLFKDPRGLLVGLITLPSDA